MGVDTSFLQNLDLRRVLAPAPKVLGSDIKTHLHTPKGVAYHEQSHYCRFTIGHSLARMESRCYAISILHSVCPAGPGHHDYISLSIMSVETGSCATFPICHGICMEEHTCEARLPHINGNVVRK